MRFYKYHALGNDYIVCDPVDFPQWKNGPSVDEIRVICHRNFGVGSDGILWGPLPSEKSEFGLRIFNPDGSEAEKSGNGLRIFSRYLWDQKLAKNATFTIETPGGQVTSVIKEDGKLITVDMGSVSFVSTKIPHTGPEREVINEQITVLDRTFTYCSATIGNPHCVLPLPEVSAELAHKYGPHLETHANFPRKTNVQFLQVLDRDLGTRRRLHARFRQQLQRRRLGRPQARSRGQRHHRPHARRHHRHRDRRQLRDPHDRHRQQSRRRRHAPAALRGQSLTRKQKGPPLTTAGLFVSGKS